MIHAASDVNPCPANRQIKRTFAMAEKIRFRKFIRVQEFLLRTLSLWPRSDGNYAIVHALNAFLTCFVVSYLFLFTLIMYMFVNFEDKEALADASYYLLTQFTYVVKLTTFFLKRDKFKAILAQLDAPVFDYRKPHEGFVKKWFVFSDIFIKNYLIVCYTVWVFYTIFPILDKDENNILPFQAWVPFDVKTNLVSRGFVYGFQVFGLGSAIAVNVSMDSILTALLNVGSAQIEILKYNLEKALDNSKEALGGCSKSRCGDYDCYSEEVELISREADDLLYETLKKCVEHQKAVIKFLSDTEDVFGIGMFLQFVSSGIIICITGLQLVLISPSSIKFFSIISYFVAMVVQISAYCLNGHDVIVQSSDIVDCCYKMDWYRASARVKKTLFFIMERSKVPLEISAGKFFILSITTLTTILRTAYSYFAVLRRVYNKD